MSYPVIQRFVDMVRRTSRSRSTVLNLPMDQAQDLANELTQLLLRENELLEEISQLKSQSGVTEIVVGGGGF